MEKKLFDKTGNEVGKIKLTDSVFNQNINQGLLWETVNALLKNKRQGCASTKTKAEAKGSGKKPWRQKGIGWARHGSIRSPLWKGGGVVFGPKPRDYSVTIPKKKKIKALLSSLSSKAKEDKIMIVEDLDMESHKTKDLSVILKNLNLSNITTLVGVEEINRNLKLAGRNIPYVNLKRVSDINCHDVLSVDCLLLTKKGLKKLEQRCSTKKL